MYRIIGAIFIIVGCTTIGRVKTTFDKHNIRQVEELIKALNIMVCELEFRRTSLPELCSFISGCTKGLTADYFSILSNELLAQTMPDVKSCVSTTISKCCKMYISINNLFRRLGDSLGIFDVDGQVKQLKFIINIAENELTYLRSKYEKCGRTAQTLWICAGVAFAVILI